MKDEVNASSKRINSYLLLLAIILDNYLLIDK